MQTIISAAGFNGRLGTPGPKSLLKISRETILERLVRTLPHPITIIINDLWSRKFGAFSDRAKIYNNGLKEPNDKVGCLTNILNYIKNEKVEEDLLIVCADIIFNFPLIPLLFIFESERRNICIPIKKLSPVETIRAGSVMVDDKGRVTNFLEHGLIVEADYSELGIYLIPKEYIYLIEECIEKHNNDAPGYLIEYAYKKVPVYGVEVYGDWFHITTQEDYLNVINHEC